VSALKVATWNVNSLRVRLPQLVRIRVKTAQGTVLPDLVVKLMLGEEAGCLESVYQRQCRPRRPA